MQFKPCNIHLWTEESYLAIVASVSFHSFKQLDSIMQRFGCRVQNKVMHWANPGFSPATIASILHLTDAKD